VTLMLAVAITATVLIVTVFSILQRAERDRNAHRNDRLSGFGVLEQGERDGGVGNVGNPWFSGSLLANSGDTALSSIVWRPLMRLEEFEVRRRQ
jgi:hypothetical protein